jgi:hypothetical protein
MPSGPKFKQTKLVSIKQSGHCRLCAENKGAARVKGPSSQDYPHGDVSHPCYRVEVGRRSLTAPRYHLSEIAATFEWSYYDPKR